MTKAEIVNEVAKATGIEKATVQIVVESFMESVKNSLAKGNPVYLRGFGSFIIKHRAEKAARNITKNTTMTIPAHNIPAFKPAKEQVAIAVINLSAGSLCLFFLGITFFGFCVQFFMTQDLHLIHTHPHIHKSAT